MIVGKGQPPVNLQDEKISFGPEARLSLVGLTKNSATEKGSKMEVNLPELEAKQLIGR